MCNVEEKKKPTTNKNQPNTKTRHTMQKLDTS